MSPLENRIYAAIREIPASNPAYISAATSTLGRVLDDGLLREIAKQAASVIILDQSFGAETK